MTVDELIEQLTKLQGHLPVEVRNEAGDKDIARSVTVVGNVFRESGRMHVYISTSEDWE